MYITRIDRKKPSKEAIQKAVETLENGGLVVFPTETSYGLACDALNASAVERVFALKERETVKTLPLIVATKAMATKFGFLNRMTKHLVKSFWPGPLTVVVPGVPGFPKGITNTYGEIAVRVSSDPLATALCRGLGHPIVSTSANRSKKGPHYDALSVVGDFGFEAGVVLDAGKLPKRAPSTVVRCGEEGCEILREGAIATGKIVKALKTI